MKSHIFFFKFSLFCVTIRPGKFLTTLKGLMNMKNVNVRKLALAGILVAVGIVCSPLSIPVGASRCAPIQHFINILGGVFLGPWYSLGTAFITSLLRNLMGTGTLLAFPGSMCGALICGLLYQYTRCLLYTSPSPRDRSV